MYGRFGRSSGITAGLLDQRRSVNAVLRGVGKGSALLSIMTAGSDDAAEKLQVAAEKGDTSTVAWLLRPDGVRNVDYRSELVQPWP